MIDDDEESAYYQGMQDDLIHKWEQEALTLRPPPDVAPTLPLKLNFRQLAR